MAAGFDSAGFLPGSKNIARTAFAVLFLMQRPFGAVMRMRPFMTGGRLGFP